MSMTRIPTKQHREAGMVAIMVTMILMIVISLIVLGFAQISRRTQRQALDRQLSTQAFYAAETGVNDAAKLIKDAVATSTPVPDKTDCPVSGSGFYASLTPVLDSAASVEYTCLLVDASPSSLEYSPVGSNRSTIVPIVATSGTISRITLTWKSLEAGNPTPAASCPSSTTANNFSTNASWTTSNCGYGVLRFDVVPTSVARDMAGWQSATMSSFAIPLRPGGTGGSATISYATGGANNRVGSLCTNTSCTLNIDFAAPQSQYYMRFLSLYKDASLTVTASSGGTPVDMTGAQALIDVTGKAEDVLRRIQVRLPISGSSSNQLSDYAMAITRPICKRFSIMDGFYLGDAETVVPGVAGVSSNPLCRNAP
jgi:Tfp pilus assembly protein PilX